MAGGSENDIFRFTSLVDSQTSAQDVINDFTQGQDRFDVTGLGFTGLDSGASPTAGHLGTYTSGGYTYVTDGHDFSVQLVGTIALTNADIICS